MSRTVKAGRKVTPFRGYDEQAAQEELESDALTQAGHAEPGAGGFILETLVECLAECDSA
ncbi:MAG: hypothetical protein WA484_02900 [Solirubrobacteraceae bacterium]